MRSIQSSYEKNQKCNPCLGSYPCLATAVKERGFSRKSLVKAFNELMPKEEYVENEKKVLIDHLDYLTNLPVEGEKGANFDLRGV